MKILLKTMVDDKTVTVFQVPTAMILENWELPESTENNIEIGDFVEDIIDGLKWPMTVLNSPNIIVQAIEITWLKSAIEQGADETRLRHCLKGIRVSDLKR